MENATYFPSIKPEDKYSTITVIFIFCYVMLMIITVIGNTLALMVFRRYNELRTPVNFFLISLAITDILKGGIQDGLTLCGLLKIRAFQRNRVLCNVCGFLLSAFYVGAIYTLTVTGVFRYLIVVNSMKHWITRKVVIVAIVMIWFYACFISFLPVLGWNRYIYAKSQLLCLLDVTLEISYPIVVIIMDIMIPILLLGYCYLKIYMVMKQNIRRRVSILNSKCRSGSCYSRFHKREIQMTRMMFSVYLAFVICYIPYIVQLYVMTKPSTDNNTPNTIVLLTGFILNISSAINPFLYGFTSEKFRRSYYRYLCCLFHNARNRVLPTS